MTPEETLIEQVSELLERKRHREALKQVREAWAQGTRSVNLKLLEAEACKGLLPPDVKGAMTAYQEAIALEPDNWRPYNDLGVCLMNEGRRHLPDAVETLHQARDRAPADEPGPSLNLALAYLRCGYRNEGVSLTEQIVRELSPDHPLHAQAVVLLDSLR